MSGEVSICESSCGGVSNAAQGSTIQQSSRNPAVEISLLATHPDPDNLARMQEPHICATISSPRRNLLGATMAPIAAVQQRRERQPVGLEGRQRYLSARHGVSACLASCMPPAVLISLMVSTRTRTGNLTTVLRTSYELSICVSDKATRSKAGI
jgi:hypothetical protein